jgi:hypothetical protein
MYLHIIIILILIFLIYYLNKKKLEGYDIVQKYFLNSNEQLEILNTLIKNGIIYKKINNIEFTKKNNQDIIDISGNANVNINNYFNINNVDIRQYLIGCTLFKIDSTNFLSNRENNGYKVDFNIGLYNLTDASGVDDLYNKSYNVIIVYPGFGVYASQYNLGNTNTQYINIENYGNKPLKVNLETGDIIMSTVIPQYAPNNVNIEPSKNLYNNDTATYKITKSNFVNLKKYVEVLYVYLIPISKWKLSNN